MVSSCRSLAGHCLSYEYEIRKEAYKLCRLRAVGFAASLSHLRQRTQDTALGSADRHRELFELQRCHDRKA